MYSELIYTRCGEGIDILRGKAPIKNSGFKVFSCSDTINANAEIDIPFLNAIAQSKEPYSDPTFMDDAYLYVVPDIGDRFLLNFHPIPFDKNATGDYSHRPGNFINQIFIGPYHDIYPYETFGNKILWDAKEKGEAFYYENSPMPLSTHLDLGDSVGSIGIDEIDSFVNDGRRQSLKETISFILSQYSLPPEERKFLVIKDENEQLIELWIAAIESAFSPRMASGLSFATRLDKFTSSNKYTVNLNGQYQTQINLQSPNQKVRLRAMIVGIDERDRNNSALARVMINSPFIVLDGKEKRLSVRMDTSGEYYQIATIYDENHDYFCREFLQSISICSPTADIIPLYEAYFHLTKYESEQKLNSLIQAINILKKYTILNTSYTRSIYTRIKDDISTFLQADAVAAFSLMDWLGYLAEVIGDKTINNDLNDAVCTAYANRVYTYPCGTKTQELHNKIKGSEFASAASIYMVSDATINQFIDCFQKYNSNDWFSFAKLFTDNLLSSQGKMNLTSHTVLLQSIGAQYSDANIENAAKISSWFSSVDTQETVQMLLREASTSEDSDYISFLIRVVYSCNPELTSSAKNMDAFYKQLYDLGLEDYFIMILVQKAHSLNNAKDKESFLDWLISKNEFRKMDLASCIAQIDRNLNITDKTAFSLARKIQQYKPVELQCVRSAHLSVLEILIDNRYFKTVPETVDNLIKQGVPSIEDDSYASIYVDSLLEPKELHPYFSKFIAAASRSIYYSEKVVTSTMDCLGTKQEYVISCVVEIAGRINSQNYYSFFVREFANIKQFDKAMNSIGKELQSKKAQLYFENIIRESKAIHDQKKEPSLFGRLFSKK